MKKIVLMVLSAVYLFAVIDIKTATKEQFMSIDGIGEKKAEAIIEYRKANEIQKVEDLLKVKGIGPEIVNNIKNDIKNK